MASRTNKISPIRSIWIIVLFHLIGVVLILSTDHGASLSYFNLLLCAILLFLAEKRIKTAFLTLITLFLVGYIIEYIGVHTGLLFGSYWYGDSLGPKFNGIPLIIGLNWYIIVLSSNSIAKLFKLPFAASVLLSGFFCVGMDFLIEPVAIKYDFWSWKGNSIPASNYIAWYVFSTLFSIVYQKYSQEKNIVGRAIYIIWGMFFTILNLALAWYS